MRLLKHSLPTLPQQILLVVYVDKTIQVGCKNKPQHIRSEEPRRYGASTRSTNYIGKDRNIKNKKNKQS